MKPVNLNLLNIKRLKAYRKSLLNKIVGYTSYWRGDYGYCSEEYYKDEPKYLFLCAERDRVNKELAARQMVEILKERG